MGYNGLGTNPAALVSLRGRRLRILVAGKGAERCVYVRFDLTTNTRTVEKGRVNPSPGGWVGQFV